VRNALAPAKINLALVVGPRRPDGKHEVATVLQRIDLADEIELEPAPEIEVRGFDDDTLVRDALAALGVTASVHIEKRIPVASGLGGGSSDAAAALRLANETLDEPLQPGELAAVAARLGADVPFFLTEGTQLGEGDGTELSPVDLPHDYWVVVALPEGGRKVSTKAVYEAFRGADGFEKRRARLHLRLYEALEAEDLAGFPPNDLASSPVAHELRALGAFRSDVSGAGPAVYALFARRQDAEAARRALEARGRTWLALPTR
jgi:4-diphosphocytidyl-2-C-methyl-D-erythritol kinase